MAQYRVYEDFQPGYDWIRDERSDTLVLPLEGFLRNQLKVQIASSRRIRVTGERQIEGNKWRRFYIELPVPSDSETNDIAAKFERGTLYVKFPKLITPAIMPPQPTPPPTQQAPPPPLPPPPPPPPTPLLKPTTREEPKAEEAIEKKPETKGETKTELKEKEPPKDILQESMKEANAKAKAKAPEAEPRYYPKPEESRRASLSERLSSIQVQDYMDAIAGLAAELKNKKEVINRLVVVFVVLLLGLYLKHLVVSTFGGSKSHQEL